MTANRPGIFQIGKVTERGNIVAVHGWGIQLCFARCQCHRMPENPGRLTLLEGEADGALGLRTTNPDCECCEPWATEELQAFLRDLGVLEHIRTLDGETA